MDVEYICVDGCLNGNDVFLKKITFNESCKGKSIYIQAALHASEIPGLLVLQQLLEKLELLESEGRMLGRVVVMTWANPIGMSQKIFGHNIGRFDFNATGNYDRNFLDLRVVIGKEFFFGDKKESCMIPHVKKALREYIFNVEIFDPVIKLKNILLYEALDCDQALDLHCDKISMFHVYSSWPHKTRALRLASFLKSPIVILEHESGGGTFDQAFSLLWNKVKNLLEVELPDIGFSAVIELRGQHDVEYQLARDDSNGIVCYLADEGFVNVCIDSSIVCKASIFDINDLCYIESIAVGVVSWRCAVGDSVTAGDIIAEVFSIDSGLYGNFKIESKFSGVLVAKAFNNLVSPGQKIGMLASYTSGF